MISALDLFPNVRYNLFCSTNPKWDTNKQTKDTNTEQNRRWFDKKNNGNVKQVVNLSNFISLFIILEVEQKPKLPYLSILIALWNLCSS